MEGKSWNSGIPEYSEEDLMTEADLHHLGLKMMDNIFEVYKYNVLFSERHYGVNPSYIVEKDNIKKNKSSFFSVEELV